MHAKLVSLPPSVRIRSIPCVLNFTQQAQLKKSGVSLCCELSADSVFPFQGHCWTGNEMDHRWASPFFDFQTGCMAIYPKASHSRCQQQTSTGTGRDPGYFSSSAQNRMNLLGPVRPATWIWSERSGRKVNNWSGCTNAAFLFLQNGFLSIRPNSFTCTKILSQRSICVHAFCSLRGISPSAYWQ